MRNSKCDIPGCSNKAFAHREDKDGSIVNLCRECLAIWIEENESLSTNAHPTPPAHEGWTPERIANRKHLYRTTLRHSGSRFDKRHTETKLSLLTALESALAENEALKAELEALKQDNREAIKDIAAAHTDAVEHDAEVLHGVLEGMAAVKHTRAEGHTITMDTARVEHVVTLVTLCTESTDRDAPHDLCEICRARSKCSYWVDGVDGDAQPLTDRCRDTLMTFVSGVVIEDSGANEGEKA